MSLMEDIQKLAGTYNQDKVSICYGTVISITGNKCTVNTTGMGTSMTISADLCVLGNTGFMPVPEINSTVILMFSKNVKPTVISCSTVSKILLNGDSKDALVTIVNLVTKLNNIENLVNDIISKYNVHTHPYINVATSATTSPTTSLETSTLVATQKIDIASTTIFQG